MVRSRFRDTFIFAGSIMVLLLHILIDPDTGVLTNMPFGASTVVLVLTLLKAIWFISFLHLCRRALLDYIDLKQYFLQAIKSPEGAGMAIVGVGLIMISMAIVTTAAVVTN